MKLSPNELSIIAGALGAAEEELDLVSFETWPGSEKFEKSISAQNVRERCLAAIKLLRRGSGLRP